MAAAATCTRVPTWTPQTEARPAARPWSTLRVTMYSTAGPGITSRVIAATVDTASVAGSGIRSLPHGTAMDRTRCRLGRRGEHHHRAQHLVALHLGERLLDL